MHLFRKALQQALHNEACRHGDLVYFGPTQRFVPISWVERMAGHEWECDETGACSHPTARRFGCRRGQWTDGQWACEALMLDGEIVRYRFQEIMQNLA